MGELLKGMKFNSYKDLCEFSGIKFDIHKSYLISKINQICNTHIENKEIIIDNVFGKVSDIKYKNLKYLYNVGDVVTTNHGQIEIIKQIKIYDNKRGYEYICPKDAYQGIIAESHLKRGVGCPVCSKTKCVDGINSIYDIRKDLLKFIANESDAHKYTEHSGKKILCRCPECGYEKEVMITNLSKYGFSCNFCSDGISYPNKFIYCFLNQLNINYIPEKIFEWSCGRKYDIFIPLLNMIIENHGKQHYEKSHFESCGGRSLEDEQSNDLFKQSIALQNGIGHYITLDCRESKLDYIKISIMRSELPLLLQFTENDINWNLCHEYALSSLVKEVCEYWETHHKNITVTKEFFKLDIHTVMEYLEKGSIIGYCSYKKGFCDSRSLSSIQYGSKPIYNIENDIYFFSKHECEKYFRETYSDQTFNGNALYTYINKSKKYHNNTFVYVDKHKYNDQKRLYEKGESIHTVIGDYYLERYIR